jgi:cell division protein FtsW
MKLSRESEHILAAVFLLMALGLVMTYSASAIYAGERFQDPAFFLKRQVLFVLLGLATLFLAMRVDPAWIREHARKLIFLSIGLLFLVFVPLIGKSGGGAQRWIRVFSFSFQPVELAKLVLCAYLADYLSRKSKKISQGSVAIFFPPTMVILAVCVPLILQPDMGSVVFIFALAVALFFLSGVKMRYVFLSILIGVPLIAAFVMIEPYRLRRIAAYWNPWGDPRGSGYQIIQSFIAFGLGGWKGVGLGASTQKLFYLPQGYTDFIFSIIGEELGLIGAFLVLGLFVLILIQGSRLSEQHRDPFRRLFAYSLVFVITLQAILHMLVTTGLIPTKGLPLPFVSYGGSALVFNLAAVGFLIGLDRTREE